MSREIIKNLEKYGLSKNESKVYLALVKRLEANVSDLTRDTKIPRATVYKILEKLEQEKLVSKLIKNRTRFFTLTKINQLSVNLEEKQNAVNTISPILKNLVFTARKDPSVKIMTGKEAFHSMWSDMMDSFIKEKNKDNFAIAGEGANDFHPRFFPKWKEIQEKNKIKPKIIYTESVKKFHKKNPHKNLHIERRYINNNFAFEGSINLYAGRKIAIASFDKKRPQVVIIDSPEIYTLFLFVWNSLWGGADI